MEKHVHLWWHCFLWAQEVVGILPLVNGSGSECVSYCISQCCVEHATMIVSHPFIRLTLSPHCHWSNGAGSGSREGSSQAAGFHFVQYCTYMEETVYLTFHLFKLDFENLFHNVCCLKSLSQIHDHGLSLVVCIGDGNDMGELTHQY